MKKFFLSILFLFALSISYGQVILKGRAVLNKNGIQGINILLKGTKIATKTDSAGYFKLSIPKTTDLSKSVFLVITVNGYRSFEQLVDPKYFKSKEQYLINLDQYLVPLPEANVLHVDSNKKKDNKKN